MLKKKQKDLEEQGSSKAQSVAVEGIVSSIKQSLEKMQTLIRHKEWFDLFLYLGATLFVLFIPGIGPLYPIAKALVNTVSEKIRYEYFFAGIIFLLFILYLLLKAYEVAKESGKKTRLSATIFVFALGLAIFSLLSIQLSFLPDSQTNNISWGEQTLFAKHGPEATIYDSNRKSLENYSSLFRLPSLFHPPFKVAVALPISRKDGPFQSEEVLRGVAIAQKEWNTAENHRNSQVMVAVADDGYLDSTSESEKEAARKAAIEITSDKKVLGVIGHFSSTATEETANIYERNQVVLISPTSTAVRCSEDVENSEDIEGCLKLNRYVFRTALSDDNITRDLIAYIRNERNDIKKIAIVYEADDIYSLLYKRVFIRATEQDTSNDPSDQIAVVNSSKSDDEKYDKCNISRDDFLAIDCLKKAKSEGADALLLAPSTKNSLRVENILTANSGEGFGFQLLGSDSMYQENFIEINGKARNETAGLLIPLSWHRKKTDCKELDDRLECRARKIFAQEYGYAHNEIQPTFSPLLISWRTATGYDAAIALFQAISVSQRQCGIQNYVGRKAICIKTHLQNELTTEKDQFINEETITFKNGDRSGIESVIVEAVSEGAGAGFSKL